MSFASVVCTARTAARAALTTLLFCAIVRPAWSNVCIALAELLFAIARSAASCARRSAVSSCASTSPRRTRSPSCTCTESTGSASVVVIATFCSGAISPESSVCGETVPYEAVTTGTTAFPVWRGGRCERAHPATISRTQQAASALGTRLQFDAIRPRVPNFERLGSQGIPRFEDRTRPMPMDRRDFTTLLGGSLLASPLAACAPAATEPPPPVEAARPFAESVRAIRAAIARDAADPAILPAGVPRLYEHGAPVQHAVVLYHGFTNCPQQFDELARDYHARGCNVFVPRIPHHGLKDRLTRDLANVTVSELQGFAAETFGLARGLGTTVSVLGLSLGGEALQLAHRHVGEIARQPVLQTVVRDTRNEDVAAARVIVARELVELLRAVGETVIEHDCVLHRRAVFVEPRDPGGEDRGVGGVTGDRRADRSHGLGERPCRLDGRRRFGRGRRAGRER